MGRADFVFFSFDKELGGTDGDAASKQFVIEGTPLNEDAYLLLQAFDVQSDKHRIVVNGKDLPSMDIPEGAARGTWQVWMDRIPAGFLQQGKNTFTIHKSTGADKFFIRGVSINWREKG